MNNGTSHRPKTTMTAKAAGSQRIKDEEQERAERHGRKDDPEKQRRQWR